MSVNRASQNGHIHDVTRSAHKKGDEPLLPAWELNASWRNAWLRAVARAWSDPDFADQLTARGKYTESRPSPGKTARHTKQALLDCGFTFPAFFNDLLDIEVVPYSEAKGVSATKRYRRGKVSDPNGWIQFKSELAAKLTLILPPPPDDEDRAIALADYDAAGRIYPFSWC
jgi:hypothetical protein